VEFCRSIDRFRGNLFRFTHVHDHHDSWTMDNQAEEDVNNHNHQDPAAGYDEGFAKGLPPDEGTGITPLKEQFPDWFVGPIVDIGHLASWTLTSAKPDHGIEALKSPDPELYWQSTPSLTFSYGRSDGPQPHKLNVLFPKRVKIRVPFHSLEMLMNSGSKCTWITH